MIHKLLAAQQSWKECSSRRRKETMSLILSVHPGMKYKIFAVNSSRSVPALDVTIHSFLALVPEKCCCCYTTSDRRDSLQSDQGSIDC